MAEPMTDRELIKQGEERLLRQRSPEWSGMYSWRSWLEEHGPRLLSLARRAVEIEPCTCSRCGMTKQECDADPLYDACCSRCPHPRPDVGEGSLRWCRHSYALGSCPRPGCSQDSRANAGERSEEL